MVQTNKDERVWVCFELERVQGVHELQRLWPNRCLSEEFLPPLRYSRITENTGSMALA